MAKGLSLRALAKEIGLSGHGTLVDYEHGRRIPPEDLLISCEKVLDLDDGTLRRLRLKALAERAGTEAAALLTTPAEAPPPVPGPARGPRRRRWSPRYLVPALVVVLAAGAGGIWLAGRDGGGGTAPEVGTLRFGFENSSDEWDILWGGQKAKGKITPHRHYEGSHSFEVQSEGPSADGPDKTYGYVGFGSTDPKKLATLRSGMRVTMKLWTSHPQDGYQFLVRDETSDEVNAPETPRDGAEIKGTPGPNGWATVTWTVPDVQEVTAIIVQPYQSDHEPRIFAVDAVSW